MDVAGHALRVRRASSGLTQVPGVENGVNAMTMFAATSSADDSAETRVLLLLNMVSPDDLLNDEDYSEICEDVRDECAKFGPVLSIQVPRPPVGGGSAGPGVGKIFVKFADKSACKRALQALAGRKFSDRTVVTAFFPEVSMWTEREIERESQTDS